MKRKSASEEAREGYDFFSQRAFRSAVCFFLFSREFSIRFKLKIAVRRATSLLYYFDFSFSP